MKSQGTTKTLVWHWTENRNAVKVCTPITRPLSFLSTVAPRISLGTEFTFPKIGDHRVPELRNLLTQENKNFQIPPSQDCWDKIVMTWFPCSEATDLFPPNTHSKHTCTSPWVAHSRYTHSPNTQIHPHPPHTYRKDIYTHTHILNTHTPNIHTYHVNTERNTKHLPQHTHVSQAHRYKRPKHTHLA